MAAEAPPVGYYMVHSCGDAGDHQDSCDAVFVWASSSEEARSLDPDKGREPEGVEVQRAPEADKFVELLGARFGNGYGKSGPAEDRAYRAVNFHEDGGTSCDTCGLWEFSRVPESKVCQGCDQCAECGCLCGERLDEASGVCELVATMLAVALTESNEIATANTDDGEAAAVVALRLRRACAEALQSLEPLLSHSTKRELETNYGHSLVTLRTVLREENDRG